MTADQKFIVIENQIASIMSQISELAAKYNKHHTLLLEGNGRLPLVEEVRNLQNFMQSLQFWIRAAALALLGNVIAMLVVLFMTLVKVYPILLELSQK